ncbi:hypothetical protein RFI_39238 [Reticulomyxa filosa]|uniref:Uncharacterized protein n=1 Tax=Reticulomyxa filosa TaxID=46433 RepID=X6L8G7_RETFI|nr:hypothetical protein RFI_39238 [Reticulomyxa filosa]|eukprot:ETN98272.1 hypothetical protein RFI_39238 [Reticulomyxa filosa]
MKGELVLYAEYKDKKSEFTIKADVSIFIVPTRTNAQNQIEAEGIILNHLLDGAKDVGTLQFVLRAQKDIGLIISRGLALPKQELEKKIQQFDATEINLSSNSNNIIYKKNKALQHLLLHKWKSEYLKNNGDIAISVEQWSSWWFEVFLCISNRYSYVSAISDMLANDIMPYLDSKLSKWDLFFLIPCLNYLSLLTTNNISMINFSQLFERSECLEWKEDDLDKKLISVLKTDLHIRKLDGIAIKYSEGYVLDLLIVQKDKKLSQSILEFLFLQDKNVWYHVCSTDNADKCWEVMFMVFQVDFKQWNRYFKQLNKLGVSGRDSFLSKFQTDSNFIQLVASSKNFLAFLPFVQQQKMM